MPKSLTSLKAVSTLIADLGEQLEQGDEAEVAAGVVLDALQVAIMIGATADLAALVKPWMDGKLITTIHDREVVDMDALAAARGTSK